MKKRILRNVALTCDASTYRHFFGTRDEVLNAEPIPKLMLMPMTWQGDLKPLLDAYLDQLPPLGNGLTLGNVLHAEEIGPVLDLGRQWLGSLSDRILASRDERPGALDVTEVFGQLQHLRRQMGTGDPQAVADGVRRVRDAARRASDEGEEEHGALSEGRRIADASARRTRDTLALSSINQRNADFWNKRSVTPQLDSSGRMNWRTGDVAPAQSTAFRDAMHAAAHAATPRAQIAALNRGAKAFWHRGEPASLTADMLHPCADASIASINARNRAFWAGRS